MQKIKSAEENVLFEELQKLTGSMDSVRALCYELPGSHAAAAMTLFWAVNQLNDLSKQFSEAANDDEGEILLFEQPEWRFLQAHQKEQLAADLDLIRQTLQTESVTSSPPLEKLPNTARIEQAVVWLEKAKRRLERRIRTHYRPYYLHPWQWRLVAMGVTVGLAFVIGLVFLLRKPEVWHVTYYQGTAFEEKFAESRLGQTAHGRAPRKTITKAKPAPSAK